MRLLAMLFFLCAALTAAAQTDTSYQLLWYKGKKIKPNILLTTKGDTVRFNPATGTIKVVSKSGTGKKFDQMLVELNKTNQRIQQQIDRFSKFPKPVIPYLAKPVQASFQAVHQEYSNLLSNSIVLPEIPRTSKQTGVGGAMEETTLEDEFAETIRSFRDYYRDHAIDNLQNVPVPPSYNYSYCFTCDEAGNNAFEKAMERFRAELTKGDGDMLQKALLLGRKAFFAFGEGEKLRAVFREVEMMTNYVFGRAEIRVAALIKQYMDDPDKTYAVLQVTLETDRVRQLMGNQDEYDPIPKDYFERAFLVVKKKFLQAVDERDYSIALNLQAILTLERTMQIHGGGSDGFLDKMLGFNQFKLYSNITAKMGNDGGYIAGHLRGDNWFSAIPDSTCRLRWVQTGPLVRQSKFQLLSAEFRGPAVDIPYVGTKIWNSDIPLMRVDFCSTSTDSIVAYPFHPDGDQQELWQFPAPMGVVNVAELRAALLACFMDIEQLRRDAQEMKNPAEIEKVKKEMMAQYEALMKQMNNGKVSPGDINFQSLNQHNNIQEITRRVTDMVHQKDPGRYVFTPTVHNKDKLIVKERLNGKELFPQNAATEYAWFHLTLEHDPDGPYKLRL
jgi:hypothetical protein